MKNEEMTFHDNRCSGPAASHPAAPANQNVTMNIPREKSEKRPSCFPHKLKRSNVAGDWSGSEQILKECNGGRSLMTNITCKQMRKMIISRMLDSDSNPRAFYQSTQYHTAVRSSCIPPVNTVPHGGQIIVQPFSQHSTTWWSDHRAIHWSTQ